MKRRSFLASLAALAVAPVASRAAAAVRCRPRWVDVPGVVRGVTYRAIQVGELLCFASIYVERGTMLKVDDKVYMRPETFTALATECA